MQEPDAIYIARPSRKRYLGFGLMTFACLAVVGTVWFYMMQQVIVDAASQARAKAGELNQVVEDFQSQAQPGSDLTEVFRELDELLRPAPISAPAIDGQAMLEAAAAVIKDKVISDTGPVATSDELP